MFRTTNEKPTGRGALRRCMGAAMSEFVLILPLIAVILAMLLYMQRLVVRVHHTSVMARYETWRDVSGGPGPGSDEPHGHPQLNHAFFAGNASSIGHHVDNGYFPEDVYDHAIAMAGEFSENAGVTAQAVLFRVDDEHRRSRGRREAFMVRHDNTELMWDRILASVGDAIPNPERQSALIRSNTRIGTDWTYTNNWRASADDWDRVGGSDPHQLRGVRDVYFADVDAELDGRDGRNDHEYGDTGEPEHPTGDSLAGLLRRFYLSPPGYRGPIVHREDDQIETDSDDGGS